MKKLLRIITFATAVLLCAVPAFSHGGRTDISGGHNDIKNASGLGKYHYHCDGHSAHLHKDGVCPFDIDAPDYTEEYTGEIKLKEETKNETKEKSGISKFLDVLSMIFSGICLVIAFLATVVSPIGGLIYLICIGIKSAIKKIKNRKDQR